ncbi:hypothetical protein Pfo_008060 [Paulownia fortunei]|nr:hypothetical protein Pfo_008060 [Paulownia fortunei]
MSVDVMQKAFQAIEEGNLSLVAKHWPTNPQMTAVGSCCLVSVYGMVFCMWLTLVHNTSLESVRRELHSIHPDHSHIVVLKHNVWPVKGLIQISRTIGDNIYLKKAPIFSSEPSICVHELQPHEHFLIFASDGVWKHLSNQEAINIVQNHSDVRSGSRRRLVKAALQETEKKRGMKYSDLKKIDGGVQLHFMMISQS